MSLNAFLVGVIIVSDLITFVLIAATFRILRENERLLDEFLDDLEERS